MYKQNPPLSLEQLLSLVIKDETRFDKGDYLKVILHLKDQRDDLQRKLIEIALETAK